MNPLLIKLSTLVFSVALVSACSVAKLEARLEANPQCKEVVNPKTGALMPCPGSDKAFYRDLGLAPAKPTPDPNSQIAFISTIAGSTSSDKLSPNGVVAVMGSPAKTESIPINCKPQLHKKTGGTLPCPTPD